VCAAHPQINTFFWGEWNDAAEAHKTNIYPMCVVAVQPGGSFDGVVTKLTLSITACDQVLHDNGNLNEIESDTILMLHDIYRTLMASPNWLRYIEISNCALPQKFIAKLPDEVAGWEMLLSLNIASLAGPCALPLIGYTNKKLTCPNTPV
jgi:hypothetical protein